MRKNLSFLFCVFLLVPFHVFGEGSGAVTTSQSSTITSLIETISALRDQVSDNEVRITTLEQENKNLKDILSSRGIIVQVTGSGVISFTGGTTTEVAPVSPQVSENLSAIATSYSVQFAGMIERMNREWQAVRENYQFPTGAVIGEYEFVNTGAMNRVFVDVIFTGGTLSGSYDAKLLYQFNQETFERTLLGLFIFDPGTRRYISARGSNPYSETARTRIRSPYLPGTTIAPVTTSGSTAVNTSTDTTASASSGSTDTSAEVSVSPDVPVSMTAINKAYSEKRYLSVISLSDQYLAQNAPTVELLKIRYRVYFILGKFTESLAEIQKIETLVSPLPNNIACDGRVVANHAGDTTLETRYTTICNNN